MKKTARSPSQVGMIRTKIAGTVKDSKIWKGTGIIIGMKLFMRRRKGPKREGDALILVVRLCDE